MSRAEREDAGRESHAGEQGAWSRAHAPLGNVEMGSLNLFLPPGGAAPGKKHARSSDCGTYSFKNGSRCCLLRPLLYLYTR